ncbi:phosphomevalonate kinase-like [Antedon mediterranea]|uniref:phosphomevalonate kinase-like n=1 Tax=Antedon mediterranea TaxID=105859 RepID=UPI003AF94742
MGPIVCQSGSSKQRNNVMVMTFLKSLKQKEVNKNNMEVKQKLSLILILSGKRKSGKDFIAQLIHERYRPNSCIIRLSAPLKEQFAKENEMNFTELLSSSEYKEMCRAKMITWGEEQRKQNLSVFCELATKDKYDIPIWIISDARRKTDILYFQTKYSDIVKTVRITADMSVRQSRGFNFVPGIDDAESECGLDDIEDWNFKVINNNREEDKLETQLALIFESLNKYTNKVS